MPFFVLGLVETTFDDPASDSPSWFAILHLDSFNLIGDLVSDHLFGLAKHSSGHACFPQRCVPADASDALQQSFQKDHDFFAEHRDGNFGHTFATLEEIEHALAAPGAPTLSDSNWTQVLRAIEALRGIHKDTRASQWRVVVWANW
jgi:hypothetical protein